ncbi:DUF6221 family protein [Streptomyces sp. NPDC060209]|uniref:DUF6221 family protein n=1 Tax=Streptomyces sp. NPDC060209 TaxID=3347073 RepID=UPI003666D314
MTADLAAFLHARLDEQKAAALAAGGTGADWQALGTGVYSTPLDEDAPPDVTTGPEVGGSDEDAARAEHVALHDPARTLKEVEAKRQLIVFLRPDEVYGRSLRLLAAVYSDHPEYRPEWAP